MPEAFPLYFYSPGACSLGGQVVLEWLGQPYSLCRVEREVRTQPEYLRINPRHKVPALKVGNEIILENAAILTWLAEQRPDLGLIPPAGSLARIRLLEWQSYLTSGFHAAFTAWFKPWQFFPDAAQAETVQEMAVKQIHSQYAFVEEALSGRAYLLGDQKTVLDPYFYGLSRWGRMVMDIETHYPHIARHQAHMEADPAVQFALATEKGETAESPGGQYRGHVQLAAL